MVSAQKRLFVTFMMSLTGVTLSCWWYVATDPSRLARRGLGDPMAYLKSSKDDVQRKPGSRLLWQMIDPGTPLYPGDSVKTPESGEGEVELIADKMILKLEPDSLIVLESSQDGRAALNLMSGSLFVKKEQGGAVKGGGPTIKAGNSQLELGSQSAELSLSLAGGKEASIAVSKGEVAVKSGAKTVALSQGQAGKLTENGLDKTGVLDVLAPSPQFTADLTEQPTAIRWRPLAVDFQVWLEAGPARTELKRMGSATRGDGGRLDFSFPAGTTYWRLVASSLDGKRRMESVTRRVDVVKQNAPELFSPMTESTHVLRDGETLIDFVWQTMDGVNATLLEISPDADFASPLVKEKVDGARYSSAFRKPGTYFWRVSVWYGAQTVPKTRSASFTIKKAQLTAPPKPLAPENDARVTSADGRASEALVTWEEDGAAGSFIVEVESKRDGKKRELKTVAARARLGDLSDGTYAWRVLAVGEDGNRSPWSESRTFHFTNQASLEWLLPAGDAVTFDTEKPTLILSWENHKNVKNWRMRYATNGSDLAASPWLPLQRSQVKLALKHEGSYVFEVQGVGGDGRVLATPTPRTITLTPIPTLAAPTLLAPAGPLTAEANGSIRFKWTGVGGAKEYQVALWDGKDAKLKEETTAATSGEWSDLLPGSYTLRLRTANKRGAWGEWSTPHVLNVPNKSNVEAPKAIKFKVK